MIDFEYYDLKFRKYIKNKIKLLISLGFNKILDNEWLFVYFQYIRGALLSIIY